MITKQQNSKCKVIKFTCYWRWEIFLGRIRKSLKYGLLNQPMFIKRRGKSKASWDLLVCCMVIVCYCKQSQNNKIIPIWRPMVAAQPFKKSRKKKLMSFMYPTFHIWIRWCWLPEEKQKKKKTSQRNQKASIIANNENCQTVLRLGGWLASQHLIHLFECM